MNYKKKSNTFLKLSIILILISILNDFINIYLIFRNKEYEMEIVKLT